MKFINKKNYDVAEAGAPNYIDMSSFEELLSETSGGVIGIIDTGSGKRIRFGKEVYDALGETPAVKVLMNDELVAFKAVAENVPGSYTLGKGAVLYSTELSEKIEAVAEAAGVQFREGGTTRCGRILQVQRSEDGATTVIISFG